MKTDKKPRIVMSEAVQRIATRQNLSDYDKTLHKMKLAARISDAMKYRGISKIELARKMEKNPSEITKWLSGTHNFTVDTLLELSYVLGIQLVNDENLVFEKESSLQF